MSRGRNGRKQVKKVLPPLPRTLARSLESVLRIPTAPFSEHWIRDALRKRFNALSGTSSSLDRAGNLLVRYRPRGTSSAAFCLHAHLDHPGFVARASGREFTAEGLGGIPENVVGAKVRFFAHERDSGTVAEIRSIAREKGRYRVEMRAARAISAGSIGMWNFPPLRERGEWLEGRAFDDNLGAGIVAYTAERAIKKKGKVPFDLYFTRAEEVGYIGLLGALAKGGPRLPKSILTIEMPRAGGELVAGNGVMLRAGDRNMNFDADLLLYFQDTAHALGQSLDWFAAQRRLGLFGGTEVAVFALAGYRAGCLCLPVVHGHNINLTAKGRPAPETVHRRDLLSLVALLDELIQKPWEIEKSKRNLEKGMFKRAAAWKRDLARST